MKNNELKKQLKSDMKRNWIYMAILFPIFILMYAFLFSLNLSKGMMIFLLVLTGLFFVLILEVIRHLINKKKSSTIDNEKENKKDPFSNN